MEYTRYNKVNIIEPSIAVSQSGRVYFNQSLRNILKLEPGDFVEFIEDEKGRWYLSVFEQGEGFPVKFKNSSTYISNKLMNKKLKEGVATEGKVIFPVSRIPVRNQDIFLYRINRNSVTNL